MPDRRAFRGARRLIAVGLLVAGLLLALPARPVAHDIPVDVTVQAFVAPQGDRLRLLVRVPLEAMRDFIFPQRGPGYLDLAAADSMLRDAIMVWVGDGLAVYEEGRLLADQRLQAVRVSLPSDRSFASYESALAHVTGPPLPVDTEIVWQQAVLDALFEYEIESDDSRFAIEPRWHQAALRFVALGFEHILDGIDHLLFLACLVIPFRRFMPLVAIVTSFTVAHSVTLIASAFELAPDALWFPPLVETLIALSIVYMAFENIAGVRLRRRWLITFGFGLVHGFGFSFALRETLQFAGSHLLTSLLSFNVGVELGQLLVLAVLVPLLHVLFRYAVAEKLGTILLSALVAHTAWHWMTERAAQLAQFQFEPAWPAFDLLLLASLMRWAMLLLIIAGLLWLMHMLFPQPDAGEKTGVSASSG